MKITILDRILPQPIWSIVVTMLKLTDQSVCLKQILEILETSPFRFLFILDHSAAVELSQNPAIAEYIFHRHDFTFAKPTYVSFGLAHSFKMLPQKTWPGSRPVNSPNFDLSNLNRFSLMFRVRYPFCYYLYKSFFPDR